MNKTMIFFDEFNRLAGILPGLAGDIIVTVEKDLRWEGRMAAHSNRDVSPVLVADMKIVMIHLRPRFLPLDISDLAFPGLLHLPDRARSAAYQNEKQTSPDLVLGEIFFGCQVFLFAAITIDYTNTVGLRPAA
jgi:hypothetical protein